MKTQVICLIFLLILAGGMTLYYHFHQGEEKIIEEKLYQGPVPEGYDEDYFRKTGITKPLENNYKK